MCPKKCAGSAKRTTRVEPAQDVATMADPIRITDDLAVRNQPDRSDIARLAQLGDRALINNRPDGEEPGQLTAAEARIEAERVGLAYIHLPVKTDGISAVDVQAFHRALRESPGPVAAHCKTGTRSFLLWGAGEVLKGRHPGDVAAQAAAAGYDLTLLPKVLARL